MVPAGPTRNWLRLRRDERLGLVLRVVFLASSVGVASTLPSLWLAGHARIIGVANLSLLCVLASSYAMSFFALRSGRAERSRHMLLTTWLAYPTLLLLLLPVGAEVPLVPTLTMSIATAFSGVVIVGVVALEERALAARWITGLITLYVGSATAVGLYQYPTGVSGIAWATLTGIGALLLVCMAAFALAFASDLYEAVDEADRANLAKSRFLAHMSHELRTPLTGIIGYVELLREELQDEPQAQGDLERVWLAATHLHSIIGAVLDLAKIDADKLALEWSSADLSALISQVEATAAPLTARNRNRLEIRRESLPTTLWTDSGRLRQVLINLLGNAAKFTEDGQIVLTVSGGMGRVRFEVADTGIGIPADKHEQVFHPFEQADGSTTRMYGGTGLGLAISRALVEQLGGKLELDSALGRGTRLWFTLPSPER